MSLCPVCKTPVPTSSVIPLYIMSRGDDSSPSRPGDQLEVETPRRPSRIQAAYNQRSDSRQVERREDTSDVHDTYSVTHVTLNPAVGVFPSLCVLQFQPWNRVSSLHRNESVRERLHSNVLWIALAAGVALVAAVLAT